MMSAEGGSGWLRKEKESRGEKERRGERGIESGGEERLLVERTLLAPICPGDGGGSHQLEQSLQVRAYPLRPLLQRGHRRERFLHLNRARGETHPHRPTSPKPFARSRLVSPGLNFFSLPSPPLLNPPTRPHTPPRPLSTCGFRRGVTHAFASRSIWKPTSPSCPNCRSSQEREVSRGRTTCCVGRG